MLEHLDASMKHISIQPTDDGLTIEQHALPMVERERKGLVVGVLTLFIWISWVGVAFILIMTVIAMESLPEKYGFEIHPDPASSVLSPALRWGALFGGIIFGLSKLRAMLKRTIPQYPQVLRLTDDVLIVGSTSYNIAHISQVRFNTNPRQTHGALYFTHQNEVIQFFESLPLQEAQALCRSLSDILAFRCHVVTTIVFGDKEVDDEPSEKILNNPDVAELTFPFVRLRNLIIQTDSYDFHQVERFLTYAVNAIGDDYLKEHVEVHVYGDPAKLHANLQNTLTNVCHHMHIHGKSR